MVRRAKVGQASGAWPDFGWPAALFCGEDLSIASTDSSGLKCRSGRELQSWVNSPRRAAFIAATVSALGLSGSKGRAFSAATRTSSRRKASDTVRPILFSAAEASLLVRSSIRARTTELPVTRLIPS